MEPPALAMPHTGKANEITIRSDTRLRSSDAAIAGRAAQTSADVPGMTVQPVSHFTEGKRVNKASIYK